MEDIISPQQFKEAYLEAVTKHEPEIVAHWQCSEPYTTTFRSKVLPEIGMILGLNTYSADYYTLDCIYYREKEEAPFLCNYTYAKYIAVAVEHENEASTSFIEMNKLQMINSPLKVLITYANDTVQPVKSYLIEQYSKMIRDSDAFGDISTLRKQLVIFGDLQASSPQWSFYVYEEGGLLGI